MHNDSAALKNEDHVSYRPELDFDMDQDTQEKVPRRLRSAQQQGNSHRDEEDVAPVERKDDDFFGPEEVADGSGLCRRQQGPSQYAPYSPRDEPMDETQNFDEHYDMPGTFETSQGPGREETRRWGGGKDKQPSHRHDRRMTPLPRKDDQFQRLLQEKRNLVAALSHTQTEVSALQRQMEDLQRELHGARNALAREQAHREEDRHLLETRAEELRSARTFLTKDDTYSHADIKTMVDSLNSEIMQLAAFMSDSLRFSDTPLDLSDQDTCNAINRAKFSLGDRMVALQATMARICESMIQRWHQETKIHDMFVHLYSNIKKNSTPAVAGRWRAMTRAETKYTSEADVQQLCCHIMLTHIWAVLRVAGWMEPDAKPVLERDFGGRILEISKLMKRVDQAIGEGITSEELAVYVVECDTRFNPTSMVDANHNPMSEMITDEETAVACTSDLGLRVTRKIQASSDPQVTKIETTVLMKANVVLWSTLVS
ncbi:uncharacterized protein EV420DRAFT_1483364 [Desarmillaria tabescens]|uniref:Uncharacterized protein n=1 Tax=Armillaria tabescens TaxID=1929756 RepID=A0AA39MX11_ARMTA|nr:uncharacterized protein EV420DRAFT_1483364 [Desarmillaria tabescens]KAK0448955.1 hypothetical protein EV420DRAFT_1483364 [Desarmillaria tabescens]